MPDDLPFSCHIQNPPPPPSRPPLPVSPASRAWHLLWRSWRWRALPAEHRPPGRSLAGAHVPRERSTLATRSGQATASSAPFAEQGPSPVSTPVPSGRAPTTRLRPCRHRHSAKTRALRCAPAGNSPARTARNRAAKTAANPRRAPPVESRSARRLRVRPPALRLNRAKPKAPLNASCLNGAAKAASAQTKRPPPANEAAAEKRPPDASQAVK